MAAGGADFGSFFAHRDMPAIPTYPNFYFTPTEDFRRLYVPQQRAIPFLVVLFYCRDQPEFCRKLVGTFLVGSSIYSESLGVTSAAATSAAASAATSAAAPPPAIRVASSAVIMPSATASSTCDGSNPPLSISSW